jgi:uncharacterized protein YkwD
MKRGRFYIKQTVTVQVTECSSFSKDQYTDRNREAHFSEDNGEETIYLQKKAYNRLSLNRMKTMLYRTTLITVLTFACITVCFGQAFDWADSLNTAKDVEYLTIVKKEVMHELNKVRSNPQQYVRYVKKERTYYQDKTIKKPGYATIATVEDVAAVDECIAALEKAASVEILYPHKGLSMSASELAADQAQTGQTGHIGSDGTSMSARIRKYLKQYSELGENAYYVSGDARTIVVHLLIDDGVALRGHRTTMLNSSFDFCGLAIDSHPVYRQVCVIDFGKFNNT